MRPWRWAAALKSLRADPLVLATGGVLLAVVLVRILPASLAMRAALRPAVILILPVACLVGLRRVPERDERTFWLALAAAFGCWWLVLAGQAANVLSGLVVWPRLATDVAFAAFYSLLVGALVRQAYAPARWLMTARVRLVVWPTAAIFVATLFVYFVLLPRAFGADPVATGLHAQIVYAILDAFLAGQLLVLTASSDCRRWRRIFALLSLVTAIWLLNDAQHAVALARGRPFEPSAVLALAGLVAAVFAIRLRHTPPAIDAADEAVDVTETLTLEAEARDPRAALQTVAAAAALPIVHIAAGWLDRFPTAVRNAQEILLLPAMLGLGAIALLQHRILRRALARLRNARAETEDRIRRHRLDLELQRERARASEALRTMEDRFASVFRACPSAMVILRFDDGTIVDLNASCERLTGFARHVCLGRRDVDLGVWADRRQRLRLARRLRTEGTLRDQRIDLRWSDGQLCPMAVDAARIELEDGAGVLALARPVAGTGADLDIASTLLALAEDGRIAARYHGSGASAKLADATVGHRFTGALGADADSFARFDAAVRAEGVAAGHVSCPRGGVTVRGLATVHEDGRLLSVLALEPAGPEIGDCDER